MIKQNANEICNVYQKEIEITFCSQEITTCYNNGLQLKRINY